MIVYFFKKSKDFYKGVLLLLLISSVFSYFVFIGNKKASYRYPTLQIIHTNTEFAQKKNEMLTEASLKDKRGENLFVASRIGKYYYPINCKKAQSLSIKNMLYFKDKIDAERAGYEAYLGCFD